MSMKNPLTPAGIEPATLRFVVQHTNHCATAYTVSTQIYIYIYQYNDTIYTDHITLHVSTVNGRLQANGHFLRYNKVALNEIPLSAQFIVT